MYGYQHGKLHTNSSITSILQRIADISILFLGTYIACYFSGMFFKTDEFIFVLISLVFFQMLGGLTDFYRSWRGVSISSEFILITKNWTLTLLVSTSIVVLFNIISLNYKNTLLIYVIVLFGILFGRFSIRLILGLLRKIGYNTRNVVIAGSMPAGIKLGIELQNAKWMGFNVLGYYSEKNIGSDLNYIGDLKDLVADSKNGHIDRIYLAMPMEQEGLIKSTVQELADTTCSVMLIPDTFTFNILQSRSEEINGVSVVSLFDTPMSGLNKVLKRIEDIIFSFCILAFISPILIVIAIAIKFTSSGPVIFRQKRYGIDGKPFNVWKFRTMKVLENGDKVTQAKKGDARVTKVGAFLRRTSLDELPQFINVILGDMSIVGPRPHAVAHNEDYRKRILGYMLRHKMKPGITGWAQINGWRGETDTLDKMEKRIEYDLEYIRTWSLWLDIKIIFLTIFKGFVNKSAY